MFEIYFPLLRSLVLDRVFLSSVFFPNRAPFISGKDKPCPASASVCPSHFSASLADVRVSLDGLQREDVATQFSQMTLSRQSSGETPEPPAGPVYPPSLLPQPTQQPSYVIASTGQQLPTGSFSGSQQVLQPPASPQGFVHQPPPTQVSVLLLTLGTQSWLTQNTLSSVSM